MRSSPHTVFFSNSRRMFLSAETFRGRFFRPWVAAITKRKGIRIYSPFSRKILSFKNISNPVVRETAAGRKKIRRRAHAPADLPLRPSCSCSFASVPSLRGRCRLPPPAFGFCAQPRNARSIQTCLSIRPASDVSMSLVTASPSSSARRMAAANSPRSTP